MACLTMYIVALIDMKQIITANSRQILRAVADNSEHQQHLWGLTV